jgi:hypothetical protein
VNPVRILEARAANLRAEMEAGRGGDSLFAFPVSLEPNFAPFHHQGGTRRVGLKSVRTEVPRGAKSIQLSFLRVRPSPEEEFSHDIGQQLLVSLSPGQPVAFEIAGSQGRTFVQFAAAQPEMEVVSRQVAAHYPSSELTPVQDLLHAPGGVLSSARTYRLRSSHLFPMRQVHVKEAYIALLGLLAGLGTGQCAVFQVLFTRPRGDWRANILEISHDPWDPVRSAFVDLPQLPRAAVHKVETPLFAVAVRLAASSSALLGRLEGSFLAQFEGGENGLVPIDQEYPVESILDRTTRHHGMILNAAELADLVHLPDPTQLPDSFERATTTAAPPPLATRDILVPLGINRHGGIDTQVGVAGNWLTRHVAEFGGTGYGKTTSFKAFFAAIVQSGHGLAFLDPAGDAAEEFLDLIPEHRVEDVVYFNPGNREWPPGLNVLESSERDQEMLADELMVGLERLFRGSSEFGPRMRWILRQALRTLLASEGEKTLRDVPRLLADESYRRDVLKTVADPDLEWFWKSHASFPTSVIDPVLNRLSAFLDRPTIRNIVSQPNRIDFPEILREGKIFICNLSKGILGEQHSALLGSFILSKLQLTTMARAQVPPPERTLFVVIVDEFHNYAGTGSDTTSIRSFLSEARKYGVALVTATQFTAQLDRDVLTAILGNVGTLICLRSGMADSQMLQRELGRFTADDLLNLDTGQALVRLGRAASTFNVDIVPPPAPPRSFRDDIVSLSRQRYCRPRSEVEAALSRTSEGLALKGPSEAALEPDEMAFLQRIAAHSEETVTAICNALGFSGSGGSRVRRRLKQHGFVSEVDTRLGRRGRRATFAVPTAKGYQALGERPPKGRGGPLHKHFTEVVARWAEVKGYSVAREHRLDSGWVDLHLERDGQATAVELSVTSTAERELANLHKCLMAGYGRIVILFLDESARQSCQDLATTTVALPEHTTVEVGSLNDFHRLL